MSGEEIIQRFVGVSDADFRRGIEAHLSRRLPDDWMDEFEPFRASLVSTARQRAVPRGATRLGGPPSGAPLHTALAISHQEGVMSLLRAIWIALTAHYAGARAVNGGSGHYNEQSYPGTFG